MNLTDEVMSIDYSFGIPSENTTRLEGWRSLAQRTRIGK